MSSSSQWIYGKRPVEEALVHGDPVDRIYALATLKKEGLPAIRSMAKTRGVPVHWIPAERLNRLAKGNHQGVAALRALIPYYDVQDIIPQVYQKGEVPLLLLLDHITDVRNLGAIARTAYAAGVHALLVPAKGTASINEDAIKTSAGALQHIPVCRHHSMVELIKTLQEHGIKVYGLEGRTDELVKDIDATPPIAFVLGSEDTGISTPVRYACDGLVRLPMLRTFDSYNVSVAAGMVLYEVMQKRS